ncbi:MAG: YIP1 family protein [Firmicutes bacterium]|nr:YIP1 family protein [Bacillota bacterium]
MREETTRICQYCSASLSGISGRRVRCRFCGEENFITAWSGEVQSLLDSASNFRNLKQHYNALKTYSDILIIDPECTEALWGRLLANYGVEIIGREGDVKFIITFLQETPLQNNNDYNTLLLVVRRKLDGESEAKQYENFAQKIENLRQNTLEITKTLDPYDVFICFSDTEKNIEGRKLTDYDVALSLYEKLEREGLNVFFSTQSLAGISDEEKEPIIYHALTTAKSMVLLATTNECLEETSVHNQWSRFFDIRLKDTRKELITYFWKTVRHNLLPDTLKNYFSSSKSDIRVHDDEKRSIKNLSQKVLEVNAKFCSTEKIQLRESDFKNEKESIRREKVDLGLEKRQKLGTHKIASISADAKELIASAKNAIKRGSFTFAEKLIYEDLLPEKSNNHEVILLKLFTKSEARDLDELFSHHRNLSNRELIDLYITHAPRESSEEFLNCWIELITNLKGVNSLKESLKDIEYIVQFDVSRHKQLVDFVEKKAIETLDSDIIETLERCLFSGDVGRFVFLYSSLGKRHFAKKDKTKALFYFDKALELDEGHLGTLFEKYKVKHFNDNIFTSEARADALSIFEFKHCKPETREKYLDKIIDTLIEECECTTKLCFEKNVDYYLPFYNRKKDQQVIINKVYNEMHKFGFFNIAEKYCAVAISLEPRARHYFNLLQIKLHCYSQNDLINFKDPEIYKTDEFKQAIRAAGSEGNEKFIDTLNELSRKQQENIVSKKAKRTAPIPPSPEHCVLLENARLKKKLEQVKFEKEAIKLEKEIVKAEKQKLKDKKHVYIVFALVSGIALLFASLAGTIFISLTRAFPNPPRYPSLFNLGAGITDFFRQIFGDGFWNSGLESMPIIFNILFYSGIISILVWTLLKKKKISAISKFLIAIGSIVFVLNIVASTSLLIANSNDIGRGLLNGAIHIFSQFVGGGFWQHVSLLWLSGSSEILATLNFVYYIALVMLGLGIFLHLKQKREQKIVHQIEKKYSQESDVNSL